MTPDPPGTDLAPLGRALAPLGRELAPTGSTAPRIGRPGTVAPPSRVPMARRGGATATGSPTSFGTGAVTGMGAGTEGVGRSVTMALGPDWTSLRAFAAVVALVVLAGPVIGRAIAGPVGIIVGAGLAALTCLAGAHLGTIRRPRGRVTRTTGDHLTTDVYASIPLSCNATPPVSTSVWVAVVDDRPAPQGIDGWVWACGGCRLASLPATSSAEAIDLAAVHDVLHHRTRRTAHVTHIADVARAGDRAAIQAGGRARTGHAPVCGPRTALPAVGSGESR